MDSICDINNQVLRSKAGKEYPALPLIVILGPTASGKTKLAVRLARVLHGEIISADSRQVFKGMDLGTGKDLDQYKEVPYHLIDIVSPGEIYNLHQFSQDFYSSFKQIVDNGAQPILCGGTGLYIEHILNPKPYSAVPTSITFKQSLERKSREELLVQLEKIHLPIDFNVDTSTKKRLARAIEIGLFLNNNPNFPIKKPRPIPFIVLGINPELNVRRETIAKRLEDRLNQGLIDEVNNLLTQGVSHEALQGYGLEYKFCSKYILGELNLVELKTQLTVAIQQFAKRQMTFFRGMERKGITINWLPRAEISQQEIAALKIINSYGT